MNFEYFLYQYLLKNGRAEVPDFGVFELSRESAKIDAENAVIIPPKNVVAFSYNPSLYGNDFAKFVAEETASNLFVVQSNLKNQISIWKQQLEKGEGLTLENIGQFVLDENKVIVKREDHYTEVFGLEEINIQKLKSLKSPKISGAYRINSSVLWTFFTLLLIGGISLYYLNGQSFVFGNPSKLESKKMVKKEVKVIPKVLKQDTIKKDSLNPNINAKIQKTIR